MNSILLFLLVSSAVLLFSRNAIEAQSDENRDYQLTTFDFNLTCKLGKAFCFQVGVWSVLYPEHSDFNWFKRFDAPHMCTYKNNSGISLQKYIPRRDNKVQLFHNCSDSGAIYQLYWKHYKHNADKYTRFPTFNYLIELHNRGEDCGSQCSEMASVWNTKDYFLDDNPALDMVQDGLKENVTIKERYHFT